MPALPFQHLYTQRRALWTILVCGALLPTVLCIVLGAYVLQRSHDQYERQAEQTAHNLATTIERSVASEVEKIDVVLSTTVAELEAQLQAGKLDRRAAQALLETHAQRRPEFLGVRVTDAHGLAILGPEIVGRGPFNFSDREWFLAQIDNPGAGLFMSHPVVSRVTGKQILSFSRQYRHPDGRFAGAVTVAMPLAYFYKHLTHVELGPQGAVVLRHMDLGLVGRFPPLQADHPQMVVGSKDPSTALREFVHSGRSDIIFPPSGTDPTAHLTAVRRLSQVPLLVLVHLGATDYMAGWVSELWTVLTFGLGVIAVCGLGTVFLLRSVAENQVARERIDLLAQAFDHSGEAIVVMDADGRILEVNPALLQRTGYRQEELLGRPGRVLLSPSTRLEDLATIRDALQRGEAVRCELVERTRDGRERTAWVSFTALRDASGAVTRIITNSVDLTELKQAEAHIRHLAHHDSLTQLPNREHLAARFDQALAAAQRNGTEMAMLFIDMDRFKTINDSLGHPVGDRLLVEVGQRLRGLMRDGDIVARLGGDEFVLILTEVGHQATVTAALVAAQVIDTLGRPYLIDGHKLRSTPSIGISIYPVDGDHVDALMKCADTAMYSAKATGRNTFQFFTPEMRNQDDERLTLENGLRTAIERGELRLHYQPQVELRSGRVIGMEALVRWQHPERGMVPPLKFIPVAEETGQIEEIGQWVLEEALAQVAAWRREFADPLRVAVNVSAHQFCRSNFVQRIRALLTRHGLPGQALELEITESTAMQDPTRTAATLRELRALGVALAIDDFGTGYSSMTYLKAFPLSSLKLDRSFVMDIEHDANDAAICRATIQLSHSLGLSVIAEGVENEAQLAYLRSLDCDLMQGYLFSKPLAADECTAALRHRWQATPAQLETA